VTLLLYEADLFLLLLFSLSALLVPPYFALVIFCCLSNLLPFIPSFKTCNGFVYGFLDMICISYQPICYVSFSIAVLFRCVLSVSTTKCEMSEMMKDDNDLKKKEWSPQTLTGHGRDDF
jgi:hypothetical protein